MRGLINFSEVIDIAYKVASSYIYDKDIAQDIAQITAIECYLNSEKLIEKGVHSWIYVVSKNKSLDYIKKVKKERDIIDMKFFELSVNEFVDSLKRTEDLFTLIEETPNKIIPIKQKELLIEVLNNNYNFKLLAQKHNKKYHTLRKQVYRLHQEILLYHKIQKGHIKTRPIPGTKLHDNILNFIEKFKSHINNNDLRLFDEFEIDNKVKEILLKTSINKVISYQIEFKEKNLYKLLTAYFDKNNVFNALWINLKVVDNKISIASSPILPSKIVKIQRIDLPHPLNKTFRDGVDGRPSIPLTELNKKLEECSDKIEVIYEDKKKETLVQIYYYKILYKYSKRKNVCVL